jgi:pimeloyl-ACP methyl ester carboxylesterase
MTLLRRLGRIIRVVLLVWLMGYALATGLATTYLSRSLQTFDPQKTPDDYGVAYQAVRIPSREAGIELAAWFLPNPKSTKAVLLVHGKDASRTSELQGGFVEFAAALHRRGFNILMIDLRGHGESTPAPVSFGLRERYDVLGAADWLKAHGFGHDSIGVLGVSLGGASSMGAMAESDDIAALVTDCSFADFAPMARAIWSQVTGLPQSFLAPALWLRERAGGLSIDLVKPVEDMPKLVGRPVLIIHGTNDILVPVVQGRMLHAANPTAEYWEVEGASHGGSYRQNPRAYVERVAKFFGARLQ